MENNIQVLLGGRVGGVLPPYRDHNISKFILVIGGLDTPLRGYSTTGVAL